MARTLTDVDTAKRLGYRSMVALLYIGLYGAMVEISLLIYAACCVLKEMGC